MTSAEPERAQKFHAARFGWQVETPEEMDGYALVDTGAGEAALSGDQLGGTPLVPPMDLPGDLGRMAMVADPDGSSVGLWA